MSNPEEFHTFLEILLENGYVAGVHTISDARKAAEQMGCPIKSVQVVTVHKRDMSVEELFDYQKADDRATHGIPEWLQ